MHGTLDRLGWTTERVDLLKILCEERFSATQIAARLQVTRNAVIGKANRLGLEINSKTLSNFKFKVERTLSTGNGRLLNRVGQTHNECTPKAVPIIEPRNIPLLKLKQHDCRFPVTEDSPFLFCGHPNDGESSYCSHHHALTVNQ